MLRFILTLRTYLKMRVTIATTLAVLFAVQMTAQRGFEVGGWLGISHYFGDLNTTYRIDRPGVAGGVIGRYNFNDRLSTKLSLNFGLLEARDSDSNNSFQQMRNLSFRSAVVDGTLQFEFNFLPYVHGSRDSYYTPYIFGGMTALYYNPQAKLNGEWIALQPLGTEGQPIGGEYTRVHPALAYGIGFKMDVNTAWSFNVELSSRAIFSDYLDDVSTVYPNLIELAALRGDVAATLSDRSPEVTDEPIGGEGRQRGNSRNNDAYAFLQVGLVYYIGAVECPSISRPPKK